jgi:hypothetical protein
MFEDQNYKYMLGRSSVAADTRNHCIKMYDEFPIGPSEHILVFPLLRAWDSPRFDTHGEMVDFCQQMFEVSTRKVCFRIETKQRTQGLHHLHEHGVTHEYVAFLLAASSSVD